MTLLLRMNLAVGTSFVLAGLLLVFPRSRLFASNAEPELLREAILVMGSAAAMASSSSELTAELAAGIDAAPARHVFLEGCRQARP